MPPAGLESRPPHRNRTLRPAQLDPMEDRRADEIVIELAAGEPMADDAQPVNQRQRK
jgi:hypothetical protein